MAIRVVLEQADRASDRFFVVIKGVPGNRGTHYLGNAQSLDQAQQLKAQVEEALRAYPESEPRNPAPTSWAVLEAEILPDDENARDVDP